MDYSPMYAPLSASELVIPLLAIGAVLIVPRVAVWGVRQLASLLR